jgi:hypothetical protein
MQYYHDCNNFENEIVDENSIIDVNLTEKITIFYCF